MFYPPHPQVLPCLYSSSLALAQTTPATPPGNATGAPAGGIADWWWVVLLVIVIAAAIWYFTRRRTSL